MASHYQQDPPKQAPPPYDIGWASAPPNESQQNSGGPEPRSPTVITSGPRVDAAFAPPTGQVLVINYGPSSQPMRCPHCCKQIDTNVEVKPSNRTHVTALALCCLGGCLCACLPYCIDSCQATNHTCPSCGVYLGSHNN